MSTQLRDVRRIPRAAVVDDFIMQRTRMDHLLTQEMGVEVVQVSESLRLFMSWLRRSDRARWPHVLLLGPSRTDEPSRHDTALASLRGAGIRVVALTSASTRAIARRRFEHGIEGFVSATDSEVQFLTVVDAVLRGETLISAQSHLDIHGRSTEPRLSIQEERVFTLYISGLTIATVAVAVGVRTDTARKYLSRVRRKFAAAGYPARTKIELARIAWSLGYVDPQHDTHPRASPPPLPSNEE